MKTKKIEQVDGYKDRKFTLSMNIDNKPFPFPGIVVESYNNLCLVREERAYIQGKFNTFGIYRVVKDSKGEEYLSPLMIDYSKQDDAFPVYGAPEPEVREMFRFLISQHQEQEAAKRLKDSELSLIKAEKDRREKVKAENLKFINTGLSQANVELKELAKTRTAKETFKEGRDLIIDTIVLGEIKKLLQ